jgi:excisionase family DNA binding protein
LGPDRRGPRSRGGSARPARARWREDAATLTANNGRVTFLGVDYLTVEQVAERLGRDVQMVRRWIRERRLEAERVGQIYFVRPGALRRFKVPAARPRKGRGGRDGTR